MKRSPLKRRTGLKRKTALRAKTPLKRTGRLRPISEKKKVQLAEEKLLVKQGGREFYLAAVTRCCVVCGKNRREAREAGTRLQAHHGVPQAALRARKLHYLLWDPRNAVPACEEPCHRRHSSRKRRILQSELPESVFEFAREFDLERELGKEYPR